MRAGAGFNPESCTDRIETFLQQQRFVPNDSAAFRELFKRIPDLRRMSLFT
jgi:hypothetical protein